MHVLQYYDTVLVCTLHCTCCMFKSHSAALSEADMDGMALDGAYNTRAVMVQFQALVKGKSIDARAGGWVHKKR